MIHLNGVTRALALQVDLCAAASAGAICAFRAVLMQSPVG